MHPLIIPGLIIGAIVAAVLALRKPTPAAEPYYGPPMSGPPRPPGVPPTALWDEGTQSWFDTTTGQWWTSAGVPYAAGTGPLPHTPPPGGGTPGGGAPMGDALSDLEGMLDTGEKYLDQSKSILNRTPFGGGGGGGGTKETWPTEWPNGGGWPTLTRSTFQPFMWAAYAYVRKRRGVKKSDTIARMSNGVPGKEVLNDIHGSLKRFPQYAVINAQTWGEGRDTIRRVADLVYDGKVPADVDPDSQRYYQVVNHARELKDRGESHNGARARLQGEGVPGAIADFAVNVAYGP